MSKSLQSEEFDLTLVSSLVVATVHTMDDVLHPAANWVLDLQEVKEEMNNEAGINFNIGDVQSFQSHVTEPFYTRLKENIQNRFTSRLCLNTTGWSIVLSQFLEKNLLCHL